MEKKVWMSHSAMIALLSNYRLIGRATKVLTAGEETDYRLLVRTSLYGEVQAWKCFTKTELSLWWKAPLRSKKESMMAVLHEERTASPTNETASLTNRTTSPTNRTAPPTICFHIWDLNHDLCGEHGGMTMDDGDIELKAARVWRKGEEGNEMWRLNFRNEFLSLLLLCKFFCFFLTTPGRVGLDGFVLSQPDTRPSHLGFTVPQTDITRGSSPNWLMMLNSGWVDRVGQVDPTHDQP